MENSIINNTPQLSNTQKNSYFFLNYNYETLDQKRTYLITGIERGGTSMVAGVSRALGLNLGENIGLNHEDPAFISDDKKKLIEIINKKNASSDVWGFKMPKAVKKLKFFDTTLRNPFHIFVYRNTLAVADSWINRNAGSLSNVLSRTIEYHTEQLNLINKSKSPIMLVNYERVVSTKETKLDFIKKLSEFLKIEADQNLIDEALSMITGDGGGYVNLNKEYFFVQAVSEIPVLKELKTTKTNMPHVTFEKDSLVYNNQNAGEIYRLISNKNLPKRFYLEVDLKNTNITNFNDLPIRIFFNFTGKRFPGHCSRPSFKIGINRFYVETSGLAKDISFGVVQPPKNFHTSIKIYEKSS